MDLCFFFFFRRIRPPPTFPFNDAFSRHILQFNDVHGNMCLYHARQTMAKSERERVRENQTNYQYVRAILQREIKFVTARNYHCIR